MVIVSNFLNNNTRILSKKKQQKLNKVLGGEESEQEIPNQKIKIINNQGQKAAVKIIIISLLLFDYVLYILYKPLIYRICIYYHFDT